MLTEESQNFKNPNMDENCIGVFRDIQSEFRELNSGLSYYQRIQALWSAVLEQAIYDLARQSTKKETEYWFNSDNISPASFIWICKILNVLPNKTRDIIMSQIKEID